MIECMLTLCEFNDDINLKLKEELLSLKKRCRNTIKMEELKNVLIKIFSDSPPSSGFLKIGTALFVKKYYEISINLNKIEEDFILEIMINDITKITSSESEIHISKLRALNLAKIAHEIKNPISTISLITSQHNFSKSKYKLFIN